ncbi:MAG TPA: hypothetical protein VN939_05655 [Chthoniobacterales bacterium]|jgi:hypothetical protein|nr:hypothetical protein [Chthoniobacterales bacterium]
MLTSSILADVALPIYLGQPALFLFSLLGFALIVLIEGAVLHLLRWGSWKIAFVHAFIINLVTSLIGTGLLILFGDGQIQQIPLPALFIGAFFLTVIVETIELKVLRLSVSFSRVTVNSLLANIFSYLFLGAMIYFNLYPPMLGYDRPARSWVTPTPSPSPATRN